jgi:hypothetical protein
MIQFEKSGANASTHQWPYFVDEGVRTLNQDQEELQKARLSEPSEMVGLDLMKLGLNASMHLWPSFLDEPREAEEGQKAERRKEEQPVRETRGEESCHLLAATWVLKNGYET